MSHPTAGEKSPLTSKLLNYLCAKDNQFRLNVSISSRHLFHDLPRQSFAMDPLLVIQALSSGLLGVIPSWTILLGGLNVPRWSAQHLKVGFRNSKEHAEAHYRTPFAAHYGERRCKEGPQAPYLQINLNLYFPVSNNHTSIWCLRNQSIHFTQPVISLPVYSLVNNKANRRSPLDIIAFASSNCTAKVN